VRRAEGMLPVEDMTASALNETVCWTLD